jgi:hypothetical protein
MSLSANIGGPFPRSSFMGATVVDYSITGSWGDQSTYLNLTVVEDPNNNDFFIAQDGEPPYDNGSIIGSPVQYTYGEFTFGGLIKAIDKIQNIGSYPTYRVVVVSPVEVLDAVQCVLAGYIGPTSDIIFGGQVQNNATVEVGCLLNIYGWAENGGQAFGRSQITDIGLPWEGAFGIKAGIEQLTSINSVGPSPFNFGSVINYKNNFYRVDLSNLPIAPSFYRIGGVVNMTLLEVLERFFTDAGVNWIIKLTFNDSGPHVISFITVPRLIQQPLGVIANYINEQQFVSDVSYGQELRSDITQAFLVGGALNLIQPVQNQSTTLNVLPFWGFDFNGKPIIGSKPDGTQFADDNLQMNLNATSIADIMGELGLGLSYPCSVLELRCALGNYDTWSAFIQLNKPTLSQQLQLYGSWDLTNAGIANTVIDLLNDRPEFVQTLGNMFEDNHWPAVAQRLYEFVRGQAEVYYGKKFIVVLPFEMQIAIDPTTFEVRLSNEICDAGFMPEGEQLLGLNFVNENFFLDQTGRFYPFVQYLFFSTFNSVAGRKTVQPNVAYLKGSSTVVQYNNNPQNAYLFQRCEQGEDGPVSQNGFLAGGSQIFFIQSQLGISLPAMVVTVPDAVWAQADDITGSILDLSAMMNLDISVLKDIVAQRSTSFNLQIHPPAYYPDAIAVALKSNQYTYGPWGKFSSNGKLNFEQDDGLVPWDYGGYDILNQVAIAKLNTIAMGNQVLERATIVEAGLPAGSIGDKLVDGGPVITSIRCEISVNKVTTEYSMETFVNRLGPFSIENAERLRRIGKVYQQLRRDMRQLILSNIERSNIMMANYAGFMRGTSYAVEQHTPHAVLGARLYTNGSGSYVPTAWTQTYQESLGNLGSKDSQSFKSTACVGMEALLRPYTTDVFNDFLPIQPAPDPNVNYSDLVSGATGSQFSLNPLQVGCDINWLLSGDSYSGVRVNKGQTDFSKARSVSLRGPMMICGWGYDLGGNPVPNQKTAQEVEDGVFIADFQAPLSACGTAFFNNYLTSSNQWPAAPLDVVYDKFRNVWASQGMILEGVSSGNGTAMELYVNGLATGETLKYENFYGASIPDKSRMQIGWNPLNKSWTVVSVACTTS